eukprot:5585276-Amphidinium_carterae.2
MHLQCFCCVLSATPQRPRKLVAVHCMLLRARHAYSSCIQSEQKGGQAKATHVDQASTPDQIELKRRCWTGPECEAGNPSQEQLEMSKTAPALLLSPNHHINCRTATRQDSNHCLRRMQRNSPIGQDIPL